MSDQMNRQMPRGDYFFSSVEDKLTLVIERFVEKGNDCWFWPFQKNNDGYAIIAFRGLRYRVSRVLLGLGPGSAGFNSEIAMHDCDNPACVKVGTGHLRVGTISENHEDMIVKGRDWQQRKTHCPAGHVYDEENTMYSPRSDGSGFSRICKICSIENNKRAQQRRPSRRKVNVTFGK